MTPWEIEPVTFRFVVQCLNQLSKCPINLDWSLFDALHRDVFSSSDRCVTAANAVFTNTHIFRQHGVLLRNIVKSYVIYMISKSFYTS
jgi:hypothetical protein